MKWKIWFPKSFIGFRKYIYYQWNKEKDSIDLTDENEKSDKNLLTQNEVLTDEENYDIGEPDYSLN